MQAHATRSCSQDALDQVRLDKVAGSAAVGEDEAGATRARDRVKAVAIGACVLMGAWAASAVVLLQGAGA